MTFDEILYDFGGQLGISLRADADRCCNLVFDDVVDLNIEAPTEAPDRLFLHSVLGVAPARDLPSFYEMLLEANAFGKDTGEAVLSLDASSADVMLHRVLKLEGLTLQQFTSAIEEFVARAKVWTEKVMTFEPHAAGQAAPPVDEFAVRI